MTEKCTTCKRVFANWTSYARHVCSDKPSTDSDEVKRRSAVEHLSRGDIGKAIDKFLQGGQ